MLYLQMVCAISFNLIGFTLPFRFPTTFCGCDVLSFLLFCYIEIRFLLGKGAKMADIPKIVLPHGGFRDLIVYQKSETIYQGTVLFCQRFLASHGDRTVDQMVQAARSCKQNIAEGSAASGTSKETELKLTNVARATLDELMEDYRDWLKAHQAMIWEKGNPKLEAAREYSSKHNDWEAWKSFFTTRPAEVCANLMLTICNQTAYMLDKMIQQQEADFKAYGGIRERMHAARTAIRGEQWDKALYSRMASANTLDELNAIADDVIRQVQRNRYTIAKRKCWLKS